MSTEWVYSLESQEEAEEVMREAEDLIETSRSYTQLIEDRYTEMLESIFGLFWDDETRKYSKTSDYSRFGDDIIPSDEEARNRLKNLLESSNYEYKVKMNR